MESAAGVSSFFSSALSAFLQCLTWSRVSALAGGSAAGSSGSNPAAGGGGVRDGRDGERLGPEPQPPRSGEFPVAAAPRRRRLEARIVGGEGELAGDAAGGVVGVAVAERRRV